MPISSIFAITVYVALRIAFSTVNDAHPRTPDPVPGYPGEQAMTGVMLGQKIPATAHDYQDATTDEQQITGWFGRGFGWNLAIATRAPVPTSWTSTSTAKPEAATPPTAGCAAPDWPTPPPSTCGPRPAGCTPTSPAPASTTEARRSFRRRGVTLVLFR